MKSAKRHSGLDPESRFSEASGVSQARLLGPAVMQALHKDIKNCSEPYELAEAGHFAQEWGEDIAKKALLTFE